MAGKSKMGKMLSQQLREIGNEKTEFIKNDNADDDVMVTKIEMLARKVWALALGKSPKEGVLSSGIPNASAANTIFDRLEGKAVPVNTDPGRNKATAADRVTAESKKRINEI
jgi:hypothetical protein